MKTTFKPFLFAIALSVVLFSCHKVPLSGRKQLILVSPQEMMQMSFTQYQQFLDTSKVIPANSQQTEMVRRVGTRVQKAVEAYLASQNLSSTIEGFKWEYNLVQNNQVNAWCMPGGKVVVYTGILPITQTEDGLAVVLGHEISHAIAQHGAERMSEALLANGLMTAGQTAIGVFSKNPQVMGTLFNVAVGAGAQLGLLAHSRNQESEADHIGLIFMSIAGYNPQHAISFWNRMAAGKSKVSGIETWLLSHPTDEKRINDLTKSLPEAMKYYEASKGTTNNGGIPVIKTTP